MITTTTHGVPVSSALVHASAHGLPCRVNQAHTSFPAFLLCSRQAGQFIRCHRAHANISCRQCRHQRQLIPHAQPDRKPDPNTDPDPDLQEAVQGYLKRKFDETAEQNKQRLIAQQEMSAELREHEQEVRLKLASSKKRLDESAGLAKVAPWISCQIMQAWLHQLENSEKSKVKQERHLQQQIEALEQKWDSFEQQKNQTAQGQGSQGEPSASSDLWSEALDEAAAGMERYFDRPTHVRARDQAIIALLQSALAAALIHSLFGIDFLGQWRLSQNAPIQFAFTAIYLLSLLSIGSIGSQNSNMPQLTWFPRGRAQPGWTSPIELQHRNLKVFAAMDLRQASLFTVAQALGTSVVWRGGVLLLVSSALHGNGAGYSVGLHGENIQSALQAGLVVFPAWAQSQRVLEIAVITAFIEAVCQEVTVAVEAWAQPLTLEGPGQNASYSADYMEESVTQLTEAVGEDVSLQALGLTLNGERVAQHALVSGLLALEVLVTGSLPAAILTQALGYMLGWQSVHSQPFMDDTADS